MEGERKKKRASRSNQSKNCDHPSLLLLCLKGGESEKGDQGGNF